MVQRESKPVKRPRNEGVAPARQVDYWRAVVAAGAEIERGRSTQFSPTGFYAWTGNDGEWWYVQLGPLRLTHTDGWQFVERRETLEERLTYAHRTWQEALAALRKEVAPATPMCAEALERVYGR